MYKFKHNLDFLYTSVQIDSNISSSGNRLKTYINIYIVLWLYVYMYIIYYVFSSLVYHLPYVTIKSTTQGSMHRCSEFCDHILLFLLYWHCKYDIFYCNMAIQFGVQSSDDILHVVFFQMLSKFSAGAGVVIEIRKVKRISIVLFCGIFGYKYIYSKMFTPAVDLL